MAGKTTTRIFLFPASFYFASVGLQGVIFSSLVVFTLEADPLWIGTAQSALMLSSVFFVRPAASPRAGRAAEASPRAGLELAARRRLGQEGP